MSRYIEKTIDGKEWKFRLTALEMVNLERTLKQNPMMALAELQGESIPQITKICDILYHSLKPNHPTIKKEKVYELYDQMCDEGLDIMEIISLILDIFKDAGLIPNSDESEDEETEGEEKNV